jgi:hypothetical protein
MNKWEKIHTEKAKEQGYFDLLDYYMNEGNRLLDIYGIDFYDDSVVVCLKISDRPWNVFSVWPSKSNKDDGLWFGYSNQNYRNLFSTDFPKKSLPKNFEDTVSSQHDNEWRFGYVKTKEQIDKLMIVCDRD